MASIMLNNQMVFGLEKWGIHITENIAEHIASTWEVLLADQSFCKGAWRERWKVPYGISVSKSHCNGIHSIAKVI